MIHYREVEAKNNMITYPIQVQTNIPDTYFRQVGSVRRFLFKRIKQGSTPAQAIRLVQSTMNNIELLDFSMIESTSHMAKEIDADTPVFGTRAQFDRLKYKKGDVEKDKRLFKEQKNSSIFFIGRKHDVGGNRKVALDMENNQVIIKFDRKNHFTIQLPHLPKKMHQGLSLLQSLAQQHKACFSLTLTRNSIGITFDERILSEEVYQPIKGRILSIDTNPNYIGVYISEGDKQLHKVIFDLKDLNTRNASNDKRMHEVYHINKSIINLCKHYQVEYVAFEDLNIKSKQHAKGKTFNRLVNNHWPRSKFFSNLKKHCNINGIRYKELYAAYSSTMGCLTHPQEYDSIAAAMEMNRRAQQTLTTGTDHVDLSRLPIPDLSTLRKEMTETLTGVDNWYGLHKQLKTSGLSYRNLFDRDSFTGVSFRSCSIRSGVLGHLV